MGRQDGNDVTAQRRRALGGRHLRFPQRLERGDTLIEVLIALVIISFTAVALLNSLTMSIQASAVHSRMVTINALLKNYAEEVKFQVQQQAPRPMFTSCSGPGGKPPTYPIAPPPVAPGFTATLSQASDWDPVSRSFLSNQCTTSGIQQVTVTATQVATGINDSLTLVVVDPQYPRGS